MNTQHTPGALLDLLVRLGEYMDNKADLSEDTGEYGEPRPNIEMSFQVEIESAIENLERIRNILKTKEPA